MSKSNNSFKIVFLWQNLSAFQLEEDSFLFVAPGRLFFILMPTQTLEGRRTTRSADIFSFVALNRTRREHRSQYQVQYNFTFLILQGIPSPTVQDLLSQQYKKHLSQYQFQYNLEGLPSQQYKEQFSNSIYTISFVL